MLCETLVGPDMKAVNWVTGAEHWTADGQSGVGGSSASGDGGNADTP